MTKAEAKLRIEKLKNLIDRYRYFRHVLNKELVPIEVEDSLKKELFDLEMEFPELISPDSPSQRIAGKPLEKFAKVKHPKPMLSFNDAFSRQDMENWIERMARFLGIGLSDVEQKLGGFYCEPKLDGLAVELIYEQGVFRTGSTRGDGLIGEDVTQNLKTIESIPLKLRKFKILPTKLAIRAEVVITKKNFEAVNQEQKRLGQPPFANPRNLAAGSIRQLDPKIVQKRRLDSMAYALATDLGQKTHEQEHEILRQMGFKTNNQYSRRCKNLAEVLKLHNFWQKHRDKLPYEIDGLVVVVNDNKIFEKLGVAGKAPRGAVAFKFPLKMATTVVLNIEVQVGRTGIATPIAVLKPVQIGGVTVSRATLHNEDEIRRLGVKIGDTVVVGRAGDVIPDIVRAMPELRTGKEKDFIMPKICPACQTKLIKPQNEALWRCLNSQCFSRQRKYFYHFISRGAFNIVGLGPKIVDRLIDEGLVADTSGLFKLQQGDVAHLERFAEKSAKNLIASIQARKKISLARFLYALGIRNVGEKTSQDLAEYFGTLEKIKSAEKEELSRVSDIGPVVAESIHRWFQEKRNLEFLEKLKKAGVEIITEKRKIVSEKLKGLTFVLSGALETMSREEAKKRIRELGGNISNTASRKTDYLVAGKEPGSKYEKAKKLDIKIIKERDFLKMIQYVSPS